LDAIAILPGECEDSATLVPDSKACNLAENVTNGSTIPVAEIDDLRQEIQTLRARLAQDKLARRCHERDQEFNRRMEALDLAVSGEDSSDGTALPDHFKALMAGVDVSAVRAHTQQVHQNGYTIVPDVLDAAQVEQLRQGMAPLFEYCHRLYEANKERGNQTHHVQNVLSKTTIADEVAVTPLLRAIIAGILGHDFILNAGVVAMSPDPGCSPQGLHRDDGFHTLMPRPRLPLIVTAAIALDDFTAENGGTQIAPGSSCWPSDRVPKENEIMLAEMPAGSMLLWDGAVLHGGGGNTTTDQPRRTITLNYSRGSLRTQFNQYISVPRERVLSMPAELQRDLGYHHSGTGLGGCDLQDPLKYLQRLTELGGDGNQQLLGRENDA
jgi:ectoine hydroxylase-related dioxygenase (phytanoyl-CoA dioxygenase family)